MNLMSQWWTCMIIYGRIFVRKSIPWVSLRNLFWENKIHTLKDLLHPATVKTKIAPSERAQQLIVIRLFHVMLILSVRRVNITAKKKKKNVTLFVCLLHALIVTRPPSAYLKRFLGVKNFCILLTNQFLSWNVPKKKTEKNILNWSLPLKEKNSWFIVVAA
mgnify:CR=1 FL=1